MKLPCPRRGFTLLEISVSVVLAGAMAGILARA